MDTGQDDTLEREDLDLLKRCTAKRFILFLVGSAGSAGYVVWFFRNLHVDRENEFLELVAIALMVPATCVALLVIPIFLYEWLAVATLKTQPAYRWLLNLMGAIGEARKCRPLSTGKHF